jgi:DNA-binding transcriptional ArsR family regulator
MYPLSGPVVYTIMTDDGDLSRPWEGDINDAVVEEWKQETTALERVTAVIDATAEPAYASEIAERAVVSEPTARRHLESLAEVGRIDAVSADRGTKYRRSPSTLAMRRVAGLQRQYSKPELQDGIRDLREKLQALREKHGVNDPDDLATSLEIGSDDWTDVSRWRSLEENLAVAKAALSLYDFDPDDIGAVTGNGDGSSGGRPGDGLVGFGPGRSA